MSERRTVQHYRDAPTRTVSVPDADVAHRELGPARKLGATDEFLFMPASGNRLRQIATLGDDGALRPPWGRCSPST